MITKHPEANPSPNPNRRLRVVTTYPEVKLWLVTRIEKPAFGNTLSLTASSLSLRLRASPLALRFVSLKLSQVALTWAAVWVGGWAQH